MKWLLPAKTFLLGEYAAVADLGAIILATSPCFELTLTDTPGLDGIHPDSPAGRWWHQAGNPHYGLHWYDSLNHCGGMGASSAQFVGAYMASAFLRQASVNPQEMLEAYWQCAWQGQGLRPSGYDVLAQWLSCSQLGASVSVSLPRGDLSNTLCASMPLSKGIHAFRGFDKSPRGSETLTEAPISADLPACISIHRRDNRLDSYAWPFCDLAFIIAHTGNKLATHHHLVDTTLPDNVERLDTLVTKAHQALIDVDSQALIDAINGYHQALMLMNRVSEHTQQLVSHLQRHPGLLAIKGCGAMGADVLLLVTSKPDAPVLHHQLKESNLRVLTIY